MAPGAPAGLDGEALWQATRQEFSTKFPLQAGYAAEMHFLSTDARHLLLGAPEDHRMAAQSLERPTTRAALEEILTRLAGRRLLLKIEVRADLQSHEPLSTPEAGPAHEPPASESAASSASSPKSPGIPAVTPPAAAAASDAVTFDEKEFQNDPLIREALRIFEARITKKS